MSNPTLVSKGPQKVELTAGQKYFWCRCGLSARQPWCDGAHKGTGQAPLAFTAERDGPAWLCGCKASKTPPFCDGSHNSPQDK